MRLEGSRGLSMAVQGQMEMKQATGVQDGIAWQQVGSMNSVLLEVTDLLFLLRTATFLAPSARSVLELSPGLPITLSRCCRHPLQRKKPLLVACVPFESCPCLPHTCSKSF